MTTPIYPSTPVPSFSQIIKPTYKTLETEFLSGVEQSLSLSRFKKRTIMLIYKNIHESSEWPLLESFHADCRGAYTKFWFVDLFSRYYKDEYVGRGDGSTATFDLHSVSTVDDSTLKVFVNGVEKTKTTHWNLVSGGGEAGADRITFTAGNIPATGSLITSNFTGKLRIKAKLRDELQFSINFTSYGDTESVELREVHW